MRVIVGVDAGGSSTSAAVSATNAPEVLNRAEGGPAAVSPSQVDQSASVISKTVANALAGVPNADLAMVVVGAAGAGREAERVAVTDRLARELHCPVVVRTDTEIAHQAAFHGGPGVILSVGTGAMGLAKDGDGAWHRVGGYGHAFADEIGGYNLGRGVLAAVGQAHDGRGPKTRLSEAALASIGVTSFEQMISWAAQARPAEIASLARIAIESAREGDEVATMIVGAAVGHLVAYVQRVVETAELERPAVALHGGLMHSGSILRNAVAQAVTEHLPDARILTERVDPAVGALEIAKALL